MRKRVLCAFCAALLLMSGCGSADTPEKTESIVSTKNLTETETEMTEPQITVSYDSTEADTDISSAADSETAVTPADSSSAEKVSSKKISEISDSSSSAGSEQKTKVLDQAGIEQIIKNYCDENKYAYYDLMYDDYNADGNREGFVLLTDSKLVYRQMIYIDECGNIDIMEPVLSGAYSREHKCFTNIGGVLYAVFKIPKESGSGYEYFFYTVNGTRPLRYMSVQSMVVEDSGECRMQHVENDTVVEQWVVVNDFSVNDIRSFFADIIAADDPLSPVPDPVPKPDVKTAKTTTIITTTTTAAAATTTTAVTAVPEASEDTDETDDLEETDLPEDSEDDSSIGDLPYSDPDEEDDPIEDYEYEELEEIEDDDLSDQ